MSPVLIVPKSDAIHVMTDAAFYDAAGVLLYTAPKVWQIDGLNAVFSSRGDARAFPAFAEAVARVGSRTFDDFLDRLPDVFATFDHLLEQIAPGDTGEITIAGWSEASGEPFVLYRVMRASPHAPDLEPRAVYRMPGVLFCGGDPELLGDVGRFDRDVGLAAMERARAEEHDLTCGVSETPVMGYAIGGYVLHAQIRRDGASSLEVARVWPDEVGSKINAGGEVLIAA